VSASARERSFAWGTKGVAHQNPRENIGKTVENIGNRWKIMGKSWENHGKIPELNGGL